MAACIQDCLTPPVSQIWTVPYSACCVISLKRGVSSQNISVSETAIKVKGELPDASAMLRKSGIVFTLFVCAKAEKTD